MASVLIHPEGTEELRWGMTLEERLEKIESLLVVLVGRQQVRDWYSVEDFAAIVGREVYTVREWCRLGRIQASKKQSGRGKYPLWVISHAEVLRYEREGLLPLVKH
jgi:helix-turn-helix protein